MRPVDAALQLQLVVRLDVEEQVLVKTDAGNQVSPVGTLQGAATVNVLRGGRRAGGSEPAPPHLPPADGFAVPTREERRVVFHAPFCTRPLDTHTPFPGRKAVRRPECHQDTHTGSQWVSPATQFKAHYRRRSQAALSPP